jgi:predicted O-linked N-acetylglucosamine transferase (SPINDLY family)
LSQIDYRLSDAVCDPPGSEGHHVEKLVRLPDIFWCYRPPENCPDVVELPAEQKGGPITFGCANVFSKITPTALDLWGRILARVPNSRLLLQAAAFQMELPRKTVLNALRLHGLDESRVELIARQPMSEHLRTLGRFDIALDTFPFNGGTTTCHTLWMAAPVIALAGNRHASRMGASILTSLGLSELIAQTPDDYVEIATKLAMDHARLRALRRSIRERVRSSPLMDAPRFARAMEQAFQKMWAARSAM